MKAAAIGWEPQQYLAHIESWIEVMISICQQPQQSIIAISSYLLDSHELGLSGILKALIMLQLIRQSVQ